MWLNRGFSYLCLFFVCKRWEMKIFFLFYISRLFLKIVFFIIFFLILDFKHFLTSIVLIFYSYFVFFFFFVYYYYFTFCEFSHQLTLVSFHRSLSDNKFPQVSRILLTILVSSLLISICSNSLSNPLWTVPSAPITIGINITRILLSLFCS